MSVDFPDAASDPARAALSLVEAADARAAAALATAVEDFFLADAARLDDETRHDVAALIAMMVADVANQIRARVGDIVDVDVPSAEIIAARLAKAELLRDVDLMAEVIDRARLSRIASRLPPTTKEGAASLLVRLSECPDAGVAAAARALLIAESRRRAGEAGSELPAELQHRLIWWVAAVIHETANVPGADHAIAQAALAALAAHDEGERLEARATKLAAAIDARPAEFGELLLAALGDGRLALFVAVIARAAGTGFEEVRQAVLDAAGERLWLLLRAQGLDRETVAEIGVALATADRRRDFDRLVDSIELTFAIDEDTARDSVAALCVPRDFRRARLALSMRSAA